MHATKTITRIKRLIAVLAVFSSLLITSKPVSAHVPDIVFDDERPRIVKEPEISKAYYSKLKGNLHQYKIISEESFYLYVSLLVPYVGQEETSNVEFHIMKDNKKIVMKHDFKYWKKYYEEYGGDWYLQGPEYEAEVGPGTYIIEVHSETNSEEYSLAIGKIERFGFFDIIKTILILPIIKALYWGNYINMLLYLIFIAIILFFLVRWLRKKGLKIQIYD